MTLRIISWNVNGLRSVIGKGLKSFLGKYKPDIFCLQEAKIDQDALSGISGDLSDYSLLSSLAKKKGYSGVISFLSKDFALEARKVEYGINVPDIDSEGRFVISDHKKFVLYNVYIPSGTTGDSRQDFKYRFLDLFLKHLKSLSPARRNKLIITGDFNICHRDIDIHHPREAEKRELSGFLPDERRWMDKLVNAGFVDSFRQVHGPDVSKYSWWSFRAQSRTKNLGWRIDYFFVAHALAKKVVNADILRDIQGSDHCPILLELDV